MRAGLHANDHLKNHAAHRRRRRGLRAVHLSRLRNLRVSAVTCKPFTLGNERLNLDYLRFENCRRVRMSNSLSAQHLKTLYSLGYLTVPLVGLTILSPALKKKTLLLSILLFLVPPSFGLVTIILLYSHADWVESLGDLIFFYPFSVMSFGLWSCFLGLLGALLVERSNWLKHRSTKYLKVAGASVGATIGAFVVAVLGLISASLDKSEFFAAPHFILAGACGGMVGGLIVALWYESPLSASTN